MSFNLPNHSNLVLHVKNRYSLAGTTRNRFLLKLCVGWYFSKPIFVGQMSKIDHFCFFGRFLDYWFLVGFDLSWDHMLVHKRTRIAYKGSQIPSILLTGRGGDPDFSE